MIHNTTKDWTDAQMRFLSVACLFFPLVLHYIQVLDVSSFFTFYLMAAQNLSEKSHLSRASEQVFCWRWTRRVLSIVRIGIRLRELTDG